ncbi:hypothetical protein [Empedobacter brevis]|uniref:hypothetical protein n=1 Tax=Empedobacter brevis TaxID=247 RepID=UPI003342C1FA
MRVQILYIFLGLFLFSCSTYRTKENDIIGSYSYKSKTKKVIGVSYDLTLNNNKTFIFKQKVQDARPECNGTWILSNDTIFLKCAEEKNIGIKLSSGYMNQREYTLKIISNHKLNFGNITLKKE